MPARPDHVRGGGLGARDGTVAVPAAQEEAAEHQRIGQELHDATQQELVGLSLLAQNLTDTLDNMAKDRSWQPPAEFGQPCGMSQPICACRSQTPA